jgi:hypothetical protein
MLLALVLLLSAPHARTMLTLDTLDADTTLAAQQYMYAWSSVLLAQLGELQGQRGAAQLRIAFMGDSTVRQQQRVLCVALSEPASPAAFDLASIKNDTGTPARSACSSSKLNVSVSYLAAGCTSGRLHARAEWLAAQGEAPASRPCALDVSCGACAVAGAGLPARLVAVTCEPAGAMTARPVAARGECRPGAHHTPHTRATHLEALQAPLMWWS